jgi:spore coat polysaccharide biosynthesis predicted glycosyltransferase SpsG
MPDKSFIIRFDADRRVGTGHFNRCRTLGGAIRKQGFEVIYTGRRVNASLVGILRQKQGRYLIIPEEVNWSKEAEYLFDNGARENSVVVLDISTPYAFEDTTGILSYLNMLRKRLLVVLIDGMGGNALLTKVNAQVDVVIVPYFGAEKSGLTGQNARVYLAGPQYFIFSPEYEGSRLTKREIRPVGEKVLVTLGGADPYGVTIKVLSAISNIKDRKLSVRIIVGSNFDAALKTKITDFTDISPHIFNIVHAPLSLLEHMLWCDIAVTSTGLTKYEMALTGTPSLQVSFSDDYAAVNEPFVRKGCAKHLGVHDNVDGQYLAQEIRELLENERLRRSMSEVGKSLLDGRGASRIIEVIRREI